jgi:hypothetical protein
MFLCVLLAVPLMGYSDEVTNVTWKSSLSLGATYKAGNTDKTLYTMNFMADRYAPENDWINSLYGEYGKTEGAQTEGQLRGQSDYRHKFGGNKNFFGGIFAEAYHDVIKDINVRLKIGPEVGYYFINKEVMKLDASAGINQVYERTSTGERDYGEWRVAGNYMWDFTETANYYLNVEYSANLEDAEDGNGLLVTGLKSKVSDKISMFIELRDEYDNMPDTSTTEYNDVTILAGLTYDIM